MTKKAMLAGGCFWCTEAIYKRLRGVISVMPGYTGGAAENPTYEAVSSGTTGHAEAIEITYAPEQISYSTLLEVFFATHDPTTLNRQGADVGTQYRSAIFYQNEEEKTAAEAMIAALTESNAFPNNIVTEITPFTRFFPAENYHRDYYDRNRDQGYCSIVIGPKIAKLLTTYRGKLKDEFRKTV